MKSLLIHKPTQNKYYLEVLGRTFNYCFIFWPFQFRGTFMVALFFFGWLGLEPGQDCPARLAQKQGHLALTGPHWHTLARPGLRPGYLESNQVHNQNNKGHWTAGGGGWQDRLQDLFVKCVPWPYAPTDTQIHIHTHTWRRGEVLLNNQHISKMNKP